MAYNKQFIFGKNTTQTLTSARDSERIEQLKNKGFKGQNNNLTNSDLIKASEFNYLFKLLDADLTSIKNNFDTLENSIASSANTLSNYYTKTEINSKLNDYYTKTELSNLLNNKLDVSVFNNFKSTTYTEDKRDLQNRITTVNNDKLSFSVFSSFINGSTYSDGNKLKDINNLSNYTKTADLTTYLNLSNKLNKSDFDAFKSNLTYSTNSNLKDVNNLSNYYTKEQTNSINNLTNYYNKSEINTKLSEVRNSASSSSHDNTKMDKSGGTFTGAVNINGTNPLRYYYSYNNYWETGRISNNNFRIKHYSNQLPFIEVKPDGTLVDSSLYRWITNISNKLNNLQNYVSNIEQKIKLEWVKTLEKTNLNLAPSNSVSAVSLGTSGLGDTFLITVEFKNGSNQTVGRGSFIYTEKDDIDYYRDVVVPVDNNPNKFVTPFNYGTHASLAWFKVNDGRLSFTRFSTLYDNGTTETTRTWKLNKVTVHKLTIKKIVSITSSGGGTS